MTLHAAPRHASYAALNLTIERISNPRHQRARLASDGAIDVNLRSIGWIVGCRIEVIGLLVFFPISTVEADAQSQVQCQVSSNVPVILEIRLHDLVAVVVFQLQISLTIRGNSPGQEICESIPRGNSLGADVIVEDTLQIRAILLVFLAGDKIESEKHIVIAGDLRNLVSICVSRIGIVPGEISRVRAETAAVRRTTRKGDGRYQSAEPVRIDTAHLEAGRQSGVTQRVQEDVVGGVAEYELIQKRWRHIHSHVSKCSHTRSNEIRPHRRKTGAITPQRRRSDGAPGIVNVATE